MTTRDDDELEARIRRAYREREPVPFRDELKARVLREATSAEGKPSPRTATRGRNRLMSSAALWVAGVAVALLCVVVAWPKTPLESITTTQTSRQSVRSQGPTQTVVHGFGLAYAPIEVSNVRVGTLPGEPADSCVLAELRNTSNQTLYEPDVMGVLWFTPRGGGDENWLTFVNAPAEGLKPGQTVTWGFHPSGPHAGSSQALSEIPHLRFFYSRSASAESANLVWRQAPVGVEDIQVLPVAGGPGATWQSADVYATLVNRASRTVDLADERAVIWFSQGASDTFFDPSAVRFLFHVTPELPGVSWPSALKPGERVRVEFRVLSTKGTDFFSRVCHVVLLDAPLVPQN
ncbi:hypothetical protein [Alicyclobacillus acidocaldarius]|uniref:Uncharacterized protein n=1 Tax=Alicyclobacillus acidocaldarius subsp. acidocaldarius (strain ATCC 27009 / DSM 446 / BCRC 14685 / JCM 5260 / KCTC 1825 / NBRC 15652 / NCIMB 11725 / NRRL B-14509 / 104-IA) TaxID=521098 RepID=C8WV32_ALIAD|nr:hypothetical protein [Alicyclobacillus acidocaldarius]ACV58021.1 hypothetical protein Aaci_0983 [Alicyclobacillus acidocaldarius subsp. acidocaldarius DSM 446]